MLIYRFGKVLGQNAAEMVLLSLVKIQPAGEIVYVLLGIKV